jgi:uncharacterized protein with PIN domain
MATVINSFEPSTTICPDCGGTLEPFHEHTIIVRKADRIDDEELKIIGIDMKCPDCLEIFHEGDYED